MRIAPNHSRLRLVALACWAFGAWWMLQPLLLLAARGRSSALALAVIALAVLLFAIGAAFWLLAADRRAGISFDRKGVALNLGHSAAFVGWENIASLGVSRSRSSLFALGSRGQLGIRLHNPEQYLQSYETRMPAATGPLARGVRLVEGLLRSGGPAPEPGLDAVEALRRRTGYHILIPEAQLGGRIEAFVALLEIYRASPEERRCLPSGVLIERG